MLPPLPPLPIAVPSSDRGALDCMSEEELDARVQQVHDAGASGGWAGRR